MPRPRPLGDNDHELCYTLEKTLRENKEKLSAGDVASLEALIKDGRDAVEKQDDDLITSVSERLEKEAHRVASTMYQGAGGAPEGGEPDPKPTGGGGNRGRKDIVDAEFEETQHGNP